MGNIDAAALIVALGAALEVTEVSLPEGRVLSFLSQMDAGDRVLVSTLADKVFGEEDDFSRCWHLVVRMEKRGLVAFSHKKLEGRSSHERCDRREVKVMQTKQGREALEEIGKITSLDSKQIYYS